MKKAIPCILTSIILSLSVLNTHAVVTEVACSTFNSGITNSCNQCFDGWNVYEGTARTINDTFINSTDQRVIYYLDANPTVGSFEVLQDSTTWSTSTNLLTYTDNLDRRIGGWSGREFINFAPGSQTLFLDTIPGSGIRFDGPSNGADRNNPAYRYTFTANYQLFDGRVLGEQVRHNECLFYSPAWCGDGVVDSDEWEQCDDGNLIEGDGCNSSCQIVEPDSFDLALTKQVAGTDTSFSASEIVTFNISVTNQGNVVANNTQITDYIPQWLILRDPTWTQTNNVATRSIPVINPGQTVTIPISFEVANLAGGQLVNWAEISRDSGDDIDSSPDQNNLNDCHGWNGWSGTWVNTIDPLEDNTIDGIGDNNSDGICQEWEDEDDHDPAIISVDGFDLALRKTLSTAQNSFNIGDEVRFNIEVFNQGDIVATNTEVTDYIPTGLTLDDSSWTIGSNNTATRTISSIAPGASEVITITFRLNGLAAGTITNQAEISSDSWDDCDSRADSNGNNDGNVVDNAIGTGCEPGGDEDDHDIETIIIGNDPSADDFDLALRKTLSTAQNSFSIGDEVTFNIEVFNQGDIDATNVEITDYIPVGLTLIPGIFTQNGDIATTTISNISAGASETVFIRFTINNLAPTTINNFAEISNDNGDDCDSRADSNGNNDGNVVDNAIGTGCEPGGDEDDHDIETINVVDGWDIYDLALRKTLSTAQNSFSIGDEVTFNIEVFNQGNTDATNVEITDYIPVGLTLNDSDFSQSWDTAVSIIPTIITNSSVTLTITFTINDSAPTTINNFAEISNDNGDDCDSSPDNNNNETGTALVNDAIGIGCEPGGDEDDHDIETINVIDGTTTVIPSINVLKFSANPNDQDGNTDDSNITNDFQRIDSGDDAVFAIVVTNDGNEDLTNVVLTDPEAPSCDRNAFQTQNLIALIGNNDTTFNVGEVFAYTCTDPNITSDYTNLISVTATWVSSWNQVSDDDTTRVELDTVGGGLWPRCEGIEVSGNNVTCIWSSSRTNISGRLWYG